MLRSRMNGALLRVTNEASRRMMRTVSLGTPHAPYNLKKEIKVGDFPAQRWAKHSIGGSASDRWQKHSIGQSEAEVSPKKRRSRLQRARGVANTENLTDAKLADKKETDAGEMKLDGKEMKLDKKDMRLDGKEMKPDGKDAREMKLDDAPVKKRRVLRPRKALITLTPQAVSNLRALLDQPEPQLIRIGVQNRGCSGLTYQLEYVTKPGRFDEIVEQDGVKVCIDSKALFSIVGSEMDWLDDKLLQRFVFRNPNSKGTCGCGESFMV